MLAAVGDAPNLILTVEEKIHFLRCSCYTSILCFKAWKRECLLLSHMPWDSTTVLAIFQMKTTGRFSIVLIATLVCIFFSRKNWDSLLSIHSFEFWCTMKLSQICFAPCIRAFVGLSMKHDRLSTPCKISGWNCLAKNKNDPIKLRYDVASANSLLLFALRNFSMSQMFSADCLISIYYVCTLV